MHYADWTRVKEGALKDRYAFTCGNYLILATASGRWKVSYKNRAKERFTFKERFNHIHDAMDEAALHRNGKDVEMIEFISSLTKPQQGERNDV